MKNPMRCGLATALAVAVLGGCASVSDQIKLDRFNTVARGYGSAIAMSHFEAANLFGDPPAEARELSRLQTYRVATYDVKNVDLSEDKLRVVQVVEIKYYRLDRMIVKTLRDEQLWGYDPETEMWRLKSGLPAFH
jgi:hypothetical protein